MRDNRARLIVRRSIAASDELKAGGEEIFCPDRVERLAIDFVVQFELWVMAGRNLVIYVHGRNSSAIVRLERDMADRASRCTGEKAIDWIDCASPPGATRRLESTEDVDANRPRTRRREVWEVARATDLERRSAARDDLRARGRGGDKRTGGGCL